MKFAVVGGDRRAAILCAMLARDGHRVYAYALERAEMPPEVIKTGCIQGCVYGADCVILPLPAERRAFERAAERDGAEDGGAYRRAVAGADSCGRQIFRPQLRARAAGKAET